MSTRKYMGIFNKEEAFEKAVQYFSDSHVAIEEIYAPIPVHKAVKNVAGSSGLPVLAYFLGIFSLLAILSFLYYTAAVDWPLNIGGKPSDSFPSFIVVTIVLTILLVTVFSLLAFSVSARLYPGKKAVIMHNRAMDDKFIIVLNSDKVSQAENKLRQLGADEVILYDPKHE